MNIGGRKYLGMFLCVLLSIGFGAQSLVADAVRDAIQKAITAGKGTINLTAVLNSVSPTILVTIKNSAPPKLFDFLNNIMLKNAVLKDGVAPFGGSGYTLSGVVDILGATNMPLNYYATSGGDVLEVVLAQNFKYTSLDSSLSKLDSVKWGGLRLVLSTYTYLDPLTAVEVERSGLNMLANVRIENAFLSNVQTFLNKLGNKYIKWKTVGELNAGVFIPPTIKGTTFRILLPLDIKVDFGALYKQGKMKYPPAIIQSIKLDNVVLAVVPVSLEIGFESTITIGLVSQAQSLAFTLGGTVSPTKAGIYGVMAGMYSPAFGEKWLALGDLGVALEWEYEVLAVTLELGIPVTGVVIGGTFVLGEGNNQTTIKVAAEAAIQLLGGDNPDQVGPQFGLSAKVSQISLSQIISLLKKMIISAGQSPSKLDNANLPVITFTDLELAIAPTGIELPAPLPRVKKGLRAIGKMNIAGLTGSIDINCTPELNFVIDGKGTIDPIVIPNIFSLTGMNGNNTPASFDIGVSATEAPHAEINALFTIPFIGLKQGLKFSLDSKGLFVNAVLALGAFQATGNVQLPLSNVNDFQLDFTVDNGLPDAMNKVNTAIHNELQQWSKSVQDAFNKEAGDLIKQINALQKSIDQKRDAAAYYEQECKNNSIFSQKGFEGCVTSWTKNLDADIDALHKQILQLGLSVVNAAAKVPQALFKAVDEFMDVVTMVQINKITGNLTAAQVKALQLPTVTVTVTFNWASGQQIKTLTIPGLNLKDPLASAKQIAQEIIKFILSAGMGYPPGIDPSNPNSGPTNPQIPPGVSQIVVVGNQVDPVYGVVTYEGVQIVNPPAGYNVLFLSMAPPPLGIPIGISMTSPYPIAGLQRDGMPLDSSCDAHFTFSTPAGRIDFIVRWTPTDIWIALKSLDGESVGIDFVKMVGGDQPAIQPVAFRNPKTGLRFFVYLGMREVRGRTNPDLLIWFGPSDLGYGGGG